MNAGKHGEQILPQEAMIERVRRICRLDEHLVAAMMYGSFIQSEGDEYSDIEFVFFVKEDALIDQKKWVAQIAPVELYFINEFGVGTAIFDNLVRGEFHFDKASDIKKVDESWRRTDWLPSLDVTLVLDRTGELTRRLKMVVGSPLDRDTPEQAQFLCRGFFNWFLFGLNLLARGELARALDYLGSVQRYLLWMVRLLERTMTHWPTPSKALERDISEAAYARYAACTACLDEETLWSAYLSAWGWGKEMTLSLAERHDVVLPSTLYGRLDRRLTAARRLR
jgi:lincosamide nucleotidyltransferase B/F